MIRSKKHERIFWGLFLVVPLIMPRLFGEETNLLLNPGFENGCKFPDAWKITGKLVKTDAISHDGKTCLKSEGQGWCQSKKIPVTGGKNYLAGGWVKANKEENKHYLKINWYNKSGKYLSASIIRESFNVNWRKYDKVFIAPQEAAEAQFICYAYDKDQGSVCFDDLFFERTSIIPNLLANPEFEYGSCGKPAKWNLSPHNKLSHVAWNKHSCSIRNEKGGCGSISQSMDISLKPETEIIFSARIKADIFSKTPCPNSRYGIGVNVIYVNGKSKWHVQQILPPDEQKYDWTDIYVHILNLKTTKACKINKVYMYSYSCEGTVWFSNLKLQIKEEEGNHIFNSGFESGIEQPFYWVMGKNCIWDKVSGIAHKGKYCIKIETDKSAACCYQDKVPVESSTGYLVGGWAKAERTINKHHFKIDWYDINSKHLRMSVIQEGIAVGWHEYYKILISPANAAYARFSCYGYNLRENGRVWFDDLSMIKQD